jgi:hypothetical protein
MYDGTPPGLQLLTCVSDAAFATLGESVTPVNAAMAAKPHAR